MNAIYKSYSTVIHGTQLCPPEEIGRAIAQFKQLLLPILTAERILLSEASIFEFGAGWGKNLLALKALGATDVCGVDISQEQISLGHKLGMTDILQIQPDEDIAVVCRGKHFDMILAIDVLEHLSLAQLEQLALAFNELLRPGGLLVVEVPNALAPLNPIISGDITHMRGFSGASLVQFLRLCQLEPLAVQGVAFGGTGWTYRFRSLILMWIIGPLILLITRIIYGRADPYGIHEPNLLGLGRKPGKQ